MSFAVKANSTSKGFVQGGYPETMPRFPNDLLAENPSLASWQKSLDQWWFDFRTVLQRDRDDLTGAVTDSSLSSKLTTLNEQLQAISERLNALSSTISGLQDDLASRAYIAPAPRT